MEILQILKAHNIGLNRHVDLRSNKFWGYRTFHGNLRCAPDTVRATLLLHYGTRMAGIQPLSAPGI